MKNLTLLEQLLLWTPGNPWPKGVLGEISLEQMCAHPFLSRGAFSAVLGEVGVVRQDPATKKPFRRGLVIDGFVLGGLAYLHIPHLPHLCHGRLLIVNPGFLPKLASCKYVCPRLPIPTILVKDNQGISFNFMPIQPHPEKNALPSFPFLLAEFHECDLELVTLAPQMKKAEALAEKDKLSKKLKVPPSMRPAQVSVKI